VIVIVVKWRLFEIFSRAAALGAQGRSRLRRTDPSPNTLAKSAVLRTN
jgi:hypothetical protein